MCWNNYQTKFESISLRTLKWNIPLRLGSSFSLPDVSHFLREYLLLGLLVNCKLTYIFIGHDPREWYCSNVYIIFHLIFNTKILPGEVDVVYSELVVRLLFGYDQNIGILNRGKIFLYHRRMGIPYVQNFQL